MGSWQPRRQVLEEALREALERDPHRSRRWVAVVDGNGCSWTSVEDARQVHRHRLEDLAEQHGVHLTIVLDIFHVLGYVWKAGHALCAEGSRTLEQWVLYRLGRVLEGRAVHVAAGMRRSATKRALRSRQREPVDRCANYLLKYQDYLPGLRSVPCRRAADRLGGHRRRVPPLGQRPAWYHRCTLAAVGSQAVLRLRALRSSGDFDAYWAFPGDIPARVGAYRRAPSSTRVANVHEFIRGEEEATKGEVRAWRCSKGVQTR